MICKDLFFIWFGLIVFFSVVPNSAGDQSFLSKMALTSSGFFQHVFGYFVLTGLAFLAFGKTEVSRLRTRRAPAATVRARRACALSQQEATSCQGGQTCPQRFRLRGGRGSGVEDERIENRERWNLRTLES